MKLSSQEQDDLLEIIRVLLGPDSSIAIRKRSFSERTVDAVEAIIQTLMDCNDAMKSLIVGLIGGGKMLTKGWLKRTLGKLKTELKSQRIKFDGLGCRVTAARNWKTEIIYSTY